MDKPTWQYAKNLVMEDSPDFGEPIWVDVTEVGVPLPAHPEFRGYEIIFGFITEHGYFAHALSAEGVNDGWELFPPMNYPYQFMAYYEPPQ